MARKSEHFDLTDNICLVFNCDRLTVEGEDKEELDTLSPESLEELIVTLQDWRSQWKMRLAAKEGSVV